MKSPVQRFATGVAAAILLAAVFCAGRWSVSPGAVSPAAGKRALSLSSPDGRSRPAQARDANAASPDASNWSARWARLASQPRSSQVDASCAKLLEELAATDPSRALVLALQERNQLRRANWLHGVLGGWAARAPREAAAWIDAHPELDREDAEAAVMEGAARDPATAIGLCEAFMQRDPAGSRAHAGQLVRALAERGEFDAGVAFAQGLPDAIRSEVLATAFQYWALAQPERAITAGLNLSSDAARQMALDAAASGWAQVDPAGLTEFASKLSSSSDRNQILATALREWVQADPKAASHWMARLEPAPDLDAGAAAIALCPAVDATRPDVAVGWAESITNPELKSQTLAEVVRQWALHDAVSALNYAQNSPALAPNDRATLLADLRGPE